MTPAELKDVILKIQEVSAPLEALPALDLMVIVGLFFAAAVQVAVSEGELNMKNIFAAILKYSVIFAESL